MNEEIKEKAKKTKTEYNREQRKRESGMRLANKRAIALNYAKQAAKRKCLKCDEIFMSAWFGNRVCRICKLNPIADLQPGNTDSIE